MEVQEKTLVELLQSWKVREEIIKAFIDNDISLEIFPKLTEDNLKELCPHMATRLLIKEKIDGFITATTQTETNSVGSDSVLIEKGEISSLVSLDDVTIYDYKENETTYIVRTFPDFDLSTLLQTTAGGNSILEYYKHFGCLNNTKRNQLTDLIIKHIYTHIVNSKITYEHYNILGAKIITLFPTETIATYYTKPIKKHESVNRRSIIARGKLVDKVRNLLYKYGDRKRKLSDNYCENEIPKIISIGTLKESRNTDFVWLQNNTDPWGDVEKKWKDTYYLRKETYYDNLHSFISEWRILNDHRSDVLINIDFDLMFPEKGLLFYLNWKDFYKQILNLRPTQDEIILNQIQSVEHLEDDLKIPTQISIFGHLVPPKGRLTKKEKFSTQEAIDSIFVCAKTAGDVDNVIATQKEKALSRKLSVQPYIILQGELNQASLPLLVIDNVKYYFTSIQKAFDTLFKTYHVFHARYPKASDHLYLIIQRCIYKIETEYDNVVPYIADILEKI